MQHQKLLRLVAVFLLSLTALITARQVAAEINAPAPQNQNDPLVTLNNAFREEYSRAKTEALSKARTAHHCRRRQSCDGAKREENRSQRYSRRSIKR